MTESKNLHELAQGSKYNISAPESEIELQARLKNEGYDRWVARVKDVVLFAAVLFGLGVVAWLCAQCAFSADASADDKKWATSVLSALVSGGLGYVGGKATAKHS